MARKQTRRKRKQYVWRAAAKQRIAQIAQELADPERPDDKGQRQLAQRWLGNAKKSPQISRWASLADTTFPDAKNLMLLRDRLGVSIDWLLSGDAQPAPDRVLLAGEWPADRVHALREELSAYIAGVLWDHSHGEPVIRGGEVVAYKMRRPNAFGVEPHHVFDLMHGDPLTYFAEHARGLLEQLYDDAEQQRDREDAEKWRAHVRKNMRKGAK